MNAVAPIAAGGLLTCPGCRGLYLPAACCPTCGAAAPATSGTPRRGWPIAPRGRCDCGAVVVYGPDTGHSDWCSAHTGGAL